MSRFTVKSHLREYTVNISHGTSYDYFLQEFNRGDFFIVDRNVLSIIPPGGSSIIIDADEKKKSYLGIEPIIKQLVDMGFKRNNKLIAVGGGITQDITSFISSVLYRGVEWIFFPTTLLAQADSCIGSKTSVNFGEYKNQLGGFYPPSKIYIDTNVLKSLPECELISGLGEMCHYFLIGGKGVYDRFKDLYDRAVDGDGDALSALIEMSLRIKKPMVEQDEFDRGPRNIFNYGHTFGHAIETMSKYAIPHGVAVSIGMDIANYVSAKKGLVNMDFYERVNKFLAKVYAGTDMSFLDIDKYIDALKKDKKNENGNLGLILTKGYGKMFKEMVPCDDKFREIIEDYIKGEYR